MLQRELAPRGLGGGARRLRPFNFPMSHIQASLVQAAQRQLTAHRSSIRRQHKAAVARRDYAAAGELEASLLLFAKPPARKSACARVGA